jgi:hypothetical protein
LVERYSIIAPHFAAALEVHDDIVDVWVAPIIKWARGKSWKSYVLPYFKRKRYVVTRTFP